MITLDEAYKIVMDSAFRLGTEKIEFTNSLNRILAEDIYSDISMPPFDKSAMDGYACRMEDIHNELKVIEIIPAGKSPDKEIGKNECAQIMTGAMLPDGADCVLMVEFVEKTTEHSIRYLKDKTKENICYLGEDVKKGQLVLRTGTLIKPQHVAIMASVGVTNPVVSKQPKCAVVSTGDEIVEPYFSPGKSQIRNSNSYQLLTQISNCGAVPHYLGIAKDDMDATYKTIIKGLEESDILILTGGVSMGEFDFVPEVLSKAGMEIKFQKIAVQPGKPTTFGVKENKLVFGLPGNPVSSFIQFELLVKPLIYKMMGHDFKPSKLMLPMQETYSRKRTDRMSWFPVKISEEGMVYPANYHGSAHIHGLSEADGITYISEGKAEIKKGELTDVRLI